MSSNYDDNIILEPGDEEVKRLTVSYAVVKAACMPIFESLLAVPIPLSRSGLRILDQACANGLWLRDLNREAESVGGVHSFLGTDIEQSYFRDPPPNTTFQVQSMTSPWPDDLIGTFDLVHSRFSLPGAGKFPLKKVVQAEASLLKSGGWLQLEEIDLDSTMKQLPKSGLEGGNGPAGQEVWRLLAEIFTALGVGTSFGGDLARWFEYAGLINVKAVDVVLRYGANAEYGLEGGIVGMAERDYSVEEIQKLGVEAMASTTHGLLKGAQNLSGPLSSHAKHLQTLPDRIRREVAEQGSSFIMKVVIGQRPI